MRRLLITAALLASAFAPAPAVTADGAMWNATAVGEVGYLPLEDLRSFYKLMTLPSHGEGTFSIGNGAVSLVFGPDPRELRINGCRCLLTHPAHRDAVQGLLVSKTDMVTLIDPVLRPTYIANRRLVKTIILDPAHGGHDAGIVTAYAREADVALLTANKLKALLAERGYHVVLTREVNQYLSDQQRVDCVEKELNPIFISLHLNSGRSDISGAETYTVAPCDRTEKPLPGNENDAANAALAVALQSALTARAGAKDGACRRAHYSLLSSLRCPAALVELGYATNREEGERLSTDEYQTRLAQALADGVEAFAAVMNPETTLKAAPKPVVPETPAPAKVAAGKQQAPAAPAKGKKPAAKATPKPAPKPSAKPTAKPAAKPSSKPKTPVKGKR